MHPFTSFDIHSLSNSAQIKPFINFRCHGFAQNYLPFSHPIIRPSLTMAQSQSLQHNAIIPQVLFDWNGQI
jgi:hypothetical protein